MVGGAQSVNNTQGIKEEVKEAERKGDSVPGDAQVKSEGCIKANLQTSFYYHKPIKPQ